MGSPQHKELHEESWAARFWAICSEDRSYISECSRGQLRRNPIYQMATLHFQCEVSHPGEICLSGYHLSRLIINRAVQSWKGNEIMNYKGPVGHSSMHPQSQAKARESADPRISRPHRQHSKTLSLNKQQNPKVFRCSRKNVKYKLLCQV